MFEHVGVYRIATATVAKNQELRCIRVAIGSYVFPKPPKTVAGEFAGIVTETNIDMAKIPPDIADPMWDDHSACPAWEIMIVYVIGGPREETVLAI